MAEIVGYKKTYTYVVIVGFAMTKIAKKFESEDQGDRWLDQLEKEFQGYGGCKLYECQENIEPIYDCEVDDTKIKMIIARLQEENEIRNRFRGKYKYE